MSIHTGDPNFGGVQPDMVSGFSVLLGVDNVANPD